MAYGYYTYKSSMFDDPLVTAPAPEAPDPTQAYAKSEPLARRYGDPSHANAVSPARAYGPASTSPAMRNATAAAGDEGSSAHLVMVELPWYKNEMLAAIARRDNRRVAELASTVRRRTKERRGDLLPWLSVDDPMLQENVKLVQDVLNDGFVDSWGVQNGFTPRQLLGQTDPEWLAERAKNVSDSLGVDSATAMALVNRDDPMHVVYGRFDPLASPVDQTKPLSDKAVADRRQLGVLFRNTQDLLVKFPIGSQSGFQSAQDAAAYIDAYRDVVEADGRQHGQRNFLALAGAWNALPEGVDRKGWLESVSRIARGVESRLADHGKKSGKEANAVDARADGLYALSLATAFVGQMQANGMDYSRLSDDYAAALTNAALSARMLRDSYGIDLRHEDGFVGKVAGMAIRAFTNGESGDDGGLEEFVRKTVPVIERLRTPTAVPVTDPRTGAPMVNPQDGQPVMMPVSVPFAATEDRLVKAVGSALYSGGDVTEAIGRVLKDDLNLEELAPQVASRLQGGQFTLEDIVREATGSLSAAGLSPVVNSVRESVRDVASPQGLQQLAADPTKNLPMTPYEVRTFAPAVQKLAQGLMAEDGQAPRRTDPVKLADVKTDFIRGALQGLGSGLGSQMSVFTVPGAVRALEDTRAMYSDPRLADVQQAVLTGLASADPAMRRDALLFVACCKSPLDLFPSSTARYPQEDLKSTGKSYNAAATDIFDVARPLANAFVPAAFGPAASSALAMANGLAYVSDGRIAHGKLPKSIGKSYNAARRWASDAGRSMYEWFHSAHNDAAVDVLRAAMRREGLPDQLASAGSGFRDTLLASPEFQGSVLVRSGLISAGQEGLDFKSMLRYVSAVRHGDPRLAKDDQTLPPLTDLQLRAREALATRTTENHEVERAVSLVMSKFTSQGHDTELLKKNIEPRVRADVTNKWRLNGLEGIAQYVRTSDKASLYYLPTLRPAPSPLAGQRAAARYVLDPQLPAPFYGEEATYRARLEMIYRQAKQAGLRFSDDPKSDRAAFESIAQQTRTLGPDRYRLLQAKSEEARAREHLIRLRAQLTENGSADAAPSP